MKLVRKTDVLGRLGHLFWKEWDWYLLNKVPLWTQLCFWKRKLLWPIVLFISYMTFTNFLSQTNWSRKSIFL